MRQLFVSILFLVPFLLFAHSVGQSLEKEVGGYLIDVGYDTDPIVAGEMVRFDFNITLKKSGDPVEFSTVWVRIVRKGDEGILFAGALHQPATFGFAGMTTVLPKEGEYELTARYEKEEAVSRESGFPAQKESKVIAEAAFPLTVAPAFSTEERKKFLSPSIIAAFANGIVIGMVGFWIYRKSRKAA